MIPIVSPKEMIAIEKKAFLLGSSESSLMEEAGRSIAHFIKNNISISKKILLLCGKGNNGGDTFVVGCYLKQYGYSVHALRIDSFESCSALCQSNSLRFEKLGGVIQSSSVDFFSSGIIIDGLFGTGFRSEVCYPYDQLIIQANSSKLPIFAIDIPSGLCSATGEVKTVAIHATKTCFLEYPKIGFFIGKGWDHVGALEPIRIGIPHAVKAESSLQLITAADAAALLPPIKRSRHKYQTGEVAGIAGSFNMPGAALLACLGAFRTGSGIIKLFHPENMPAGWGSDFWELIKIPYNDTCLEVIRNTCKHAKSVFAGPGLGRTADVYERLEKIISNLSTPLVLDADALAAYSKKPFSLPEQAVFTPHLGEMKTLLGAQEDLILNDHLLKICQEYAAKHGISLVLKGGPSFIFHKDQPVLISTAGDPAMATAGSGDVLCGILASLLSQGLSAHNASILGTFLHGLSGELAVQNRGTSYGLIARDLISFLEKAFIHLKGEYQ